MSKNVLIISTTPRKGGNSEVIANEFASGAKASGHNVEIVSLHSKKIDYCIGCLTCQDTGRCVIADDAEEIAKKMLVVDVVVYATPVYYYSMCGQMKTFLDRMNPLFSADYAFRDIYLIATAADGFDSAMDGTVVGLQGWVDCFSKARLKGVIRGTGLTDVGEAVDATDILRSAYDMGKNV